MKFFEPSEYQSKADAIFNDIKLKVTSILSSCDVEHIGSSSISGAVSKGDVDVFVRVAGEKFNEALDKIISLGFAIKKME